MTGTKEEKDAARGLWLLTAVLVAVALTVPFAAAMSAAWVVWSRDLRRTERFFAALVVAHGARAWVMHAAAGTLVVLAAVLVNAAAVAVVRDTAGLVPPLVVWDGGPAWLAPLWLVLAVRAAHSAARIWWLGHRLPDLGASSPELAEAVHSLLIREGMRMSTETHPRAVAADRWLKSVGAYWLRARPRFTDRVMTRIAEDQERASATERRGLAVLAAMDRGEV